MSQSKIVLVKHSLTTLILGLTIGIGASFVSHVVAVTTVPADEGLHVEGEVGIEKSLNINGPINFVNANTSSVAAKLYSKTTDDNLYFSRAGSDKAKITDAGLEVMGNITGGSLNIGSIIASGLTLNGTLGLNGRLETNNSGIGTHLAGPGQGVNWSWYGKGTWLLMGLSWQGGTQAKKVITLAIVQGDANGTTGAILGSAEYRPDGGYIGGGGFNLEIGNKSGVFRAPGISYGFIRGIRLD